MPEEITTSPATPAIRRRRRIQFSLATLLLLAFSIGDGGLIVLRWKAWAPVFTIPGYSYEAVTADGRYLLTTPIDRSDDSGVVALWDATELKRLAQVTIEVREVKKWFTTIDFIPAEHTFVTADNAGIVQVWDFDGREQQKIDTSLSRIDFVYPRKEFIVFQGVENNPAAGVNKVYSTWTICRKDGKLKFLSHGGSDVSNANRGTISDVSWDGRYVCTEDGVFDCSTGNKLAIDGDFMDAGFPPKSDELAIYNGGRSVIWELHTGRKLREFAPINVEYKTKGKLWYSEDGSTLITILDNHHYFTWDANTGAVIGLIDDFKFSYTSAHHSNSPCAYIASDRKRVISAGEIVTQGDTSTATVLHEIDVTGTLFFVPMPEYGSRLCAPQTMGSRRTMIYDRRHPEWWWGHFYRPEVWLGIGLLIVWGVKFRRWWRGGWH